MKVKILHEGITEEVLVTLILEEGRDGRHSSPSNRNHHNFRPPSRMHHLAIHKAALEPPLVGHCPARVLQALGLASLRNHLGTFS